MMSQWSELDALALAEDVRNARRSAAAVVEDVLARITDLDDTLNCFTEVFASRAREMAGRVDAMVLSGRDPGPLAGVPFGVKNLFDVRGKVTIAGSKILLDRDPASEDAALVRRMEAQGAILVGSLNMDEFAYGFSTENEHYGPTRNPHDPSRIAGGSSGGSAAAVAAGILPLTLGSDTNGSIRVPASLCGVFGMKPTYGRLDRNGLYPFVDSLDCPGLFARNAADLCAAYDVLHDGPPVLPRLDDGAADMRVARLGGWFAQPAGPAVAAAMALVATALDAPPIVELPGSDAARSAAFCISAAEGGSLHLTHLRSRARDFDSATRDRFIAGALLPAAVVEQAHRFRSWYCDQAARLFDNYDILIAPATICEAPPIGEAEVCVAGTMIPVRANLGLFTQPLSLVGMPVVCAPVAGLSGLPVGVQIIAAPWREDLALRLAADLERRGILSSPESRACRAPAQPIMEPAL